MKYSQMMLLVGVLFVSLFSSASAESIRCPDGYMPMISGYGGKTVCSPYAPNANPKVPSSYSGVGDSGRRETGTTGVRPAK